VSKTPVVLEKTDGTDRRDVGGGPQWSPDGGSIAFVVEKSQPGDSSTGIAVAEVATGQVRILTNHPGSDRTPRWSPDGKTIAFVVTWPGVGEQIMTVAAAGGLPIQQTLTRHACTDPCWSPDSRSIAFSIQSSDADLFSAGIAIIRVCTGQMHFVEHHSPANERTPRFSPDGNFLAFVSDRDGWDSLWLYNLQDESLRKLSTGPGELAHPAWSPDGKRIAFSVTEGFCSRIACISLEDESFEWWSPETGSAFWPAWSPDGQTLAFVWTDSVTPKNIWLVESATGASRQFTDTGPSGIPYDQLIKPERFTYAGANGLEIDTLLFVPHRHRRSGAGVLVVHGGPNSLTRDAFDPFLQYLVVEDGHAMLAPNVRGSLGYGREYMDLNLGDYGGLDREDWIAGVPVLIEHANVDPRRIAIWGRSYGGYAAMYSLCRNPDTFACGVAQFGVSDWLTLWDQSTAWVRRLLAHQLGHPAHDRELYLSRSVLMHSDKMEAPLLMLHGAADTGVPPDQSRYLAEKLSELQRPHELQIYPGEGHGFNEPHHIHDAALRISQFLRCHLQVQPSQTER
jgi:dipeptidyl aminopeptidase/acylaminoacyl peptidase